MLKIAIIISLFIATATVGIFGFAKISRHDVFAGYTALGLTFEGEEGFLRPLALRAIDISSVSSLPPDFSVNWKKTPILHSSLTTSTLKSLGFSFWQHDWRYGTGPWQVQAYRTIETKEAFSFTSFGFSSKTLSAFHYNIEGAVPALDPISFTYRGGTIKLPLSPAQMEAIFGKPDYSYLPGGKYPGARAAKMRIKRFFSNLHL